MNAEKLNEIKERAEKATSGPWDMQDDLFVVEGDGLILGDMVAKATSEADAKFIAHAREDIPALVAEVERLQRGRNISHVQIQQLFGTVDHLKYALQSACNALGADISDYYEED